jgi:hypothetical protein
VIGQLDSAGGAKHEVLNLAPGFAAALLDAVHPAEHYQIGHGQSAQSVEHDRLRQCRDQLQP